MKTLFDSNTTLVSRQMFRGARSLLKARLRTINPILRLDPSLHIICSPVVGLMEAQAITHDATDHAARIGSQEFVQVVARPHPHWLLIGHGSFQKS